MFADGLESVKSCIDGDSIGPVKFKRTCLSQSFDDGNQPIEVSQGRRSLEILGSYLGCFVQKLSIGPELFELNRVEKMLLNEVGLDEDRHEIGKGHIRPLPQGMASHGLHGVRCRSYFVPKSRIRSACHRDRIDPGKQKVDVA